jgi:hypothetical protein
MIITKNIQIQTKKETSNQLCRYTDRATIMTVEGSRFNFRQRQRFLSSKQRPQQIRGPPALVSWTRLRSRPAGQPPGPLPYDALSRLSNNLRYGVSKPRFRSERISPKLSASWQAPSKSFAKPVLGAHISLSGPAPIQWLPETLPGGKASQEQC